MYICDRWHEFPPSNKLPPGTIALVRVPLQDMVEGEAMKTYTRPVMNALKSIAACVVSHQDAGDSIVDNVLQNISGKMSIIGLDFTDGANSMAKSLIKTDTGGMGMLLAALAQRNVVLAGKSDARIHVCMNVLIPTYCALSSLHDTNNSAGSATNRWHDGLRPRLGFLDYTGDRMPPGLLFFLDPLQAYSELEAYRYLYVSYHSQRQLLADLDLTRQILKPPLYIYEDSMAAWDPNLSIITTDDVDSPTPLALYMKVEETKRRLHDKRRNDNKRKERGGEEDEDKEEEEEVKKNNKKHKKKHKKNGKKKKQQQRGQSISTSTSDTSTSSSSSSSSSRSDNSSSSDEEE